LVGPLPYNNSTHTFMTKTTKIAKNMENTQITPEFYNLENINSVSFIQGRQGQYRAVVKVQAGFLTVVDDLGIQANWGKQQWNSPMDVFRNFKKGALQTIQFKAEGTDHWLTVFARAGKKIKLMDLEMFLNMTVGDINQDWSNTNLYSQNNYKMAGAKSWADKAFVRNAA
jgi:hypothetical protein